MTEIQQAIEKLPSREKKALSTWLASTEEREMSGEEEAALLASLDRAAHELDAGHGVPIGKAQRMVLRGATKQSSRRKLAT